MTESYVERSPVPVLRFRVDWNAGGPAAGFRILESRLPTIKGRKFYGTFRFVPGGEEYFACASRLDTDDPGKMGLEVGEIPGGWYARRKIPDWEKNLARIPIQFKEMVRVLGDEVDPSRPTVEFYRSQAELLTLVPVRGAPRPGASRPPS
jgi:hypothetical protein